MGRSTKLQQAKGKLVSKKSRTNDPACSQAMSTWKTSGMTPEVASVLGKCRAKARMKKQAESQRGAGNETKAQVLDKRAERGLTVKDRVAKAKELIAQRKAGIAAKAAPVASARPSLREQADAARAKKGTRDERKAVLLEKNKRLMNKLSDASPDTAKAGRLRSTGKASNLKEANKIDKEYKAYASRMDVVRKRMKPLGWKSAVSATPQNPRAARLERLGAKTNEAKGLLAYERVKRADALRTQRQQAATRKPVEYEWNTKTTTTSTLPLLEQARQTRAAKGDRATRLNNLAATAAFKAEKFGTKANSLTGAAEDRAVDRMNAFQDRFYALDKAARPGTPAVAKPAKMFDRKKAAQALAREGTGIVDAVARGKEQKITGLIDRAAEVIVKREPNFSTSRAKAIAGARISDIFTHQAKKMEAKTRTTNFATSAGKRFERKYDKAFAGDKQASISDIVVSHTGTRTLGLDTGRNTATRLTREEKSAYTPKPRSPGAAEAYDARQAARAKVPAKPSLRAQAEAARAKKGSREERVAKLKERASGLVEKRFDRAFAASEGARSNYVDLGSIRRNLGSAGYNYDAYKAGINSLRRQGKVSLDSFEGIRGKLTERQMAGSITEGPANGVANRLVWASYRDGKAPMLTAAAKKKRTSRQFRANA